MFISSRRSSQLRNPKVRYIKYKSLQLVPIMGLSFNIILPSGPLYCRLVFSLNFPLNFPTSLCEHTLPCDTRRISLTNSLLNILFSANRNSFSSLTIARRRFSLILNNRSNDVFACKKNLFHCNYVTVLKSGSAIRTEVEAVHKHRARKNSTEIKLCNYSHPHVIITG